MTEKRTKAAEAVEPVEETYLDLATREVVKVSPGGEARIKPEDSLFDFYVAMKTWPARNGDQ